MSSPLGLPQAQYHSMQLAQVHDETSRRRWAVVTTAGLGVVVVLGCLVLASGLESTTSLLAVATTQIPTIAKPLVSSSSQQAAPKAFMSGPRGSHTLHTNVVRGSSASARSSSNVQANADILKALKTNDMPVVPKISPPTATTTTSSANFLSNLMLGGMAAMMALAGLGFLLQRLVSSPRGMKFAAMAMDSEDSRRAAVAEAANEEDSKPPPGCSRYKIQVKRPLGLVLEENKNGGIYVAEIAEGGNTDKAGLVNVGDELIATSALVFNNTQDYGGVSVKSGEETVRLAVRGEKFNTVMAAIATNPSQRKVTLEFQKCM